MNALLWIVASFIYNKIHDIAIYLLKKVPERMLYKNYKKEFSKNLYYRITDTVCYLFTLFKIKVIKKYKGKHKKIRPKKATIFTKHRLLKKIGGLVEILFY